ncbi:hypothetical protein [Lysinibacillus xylanilyticus]|uniref:hypothetical protein n=1 Tax=Lysinibacillus xylanilyticus TaxID=582475 RepID=UPI003D076D6E
MAQVLDFSISVAKAGSSGQAIQADSKKWTRPDVYGNVDVTKYNVKNIMELEYTLVPRQNI